MYYVSMYYDVAEYDYILPSYIVYWNYVARPQRLHVEQLANQLTLTTSLPLI